MSEQSPLDLYNVITEFGKADWIEEIHIFGSRRYLSNASYGSDIDLLIVSNRQAPIDKLSEIVKEPYIDAFMLDGALPISAMNDSRINVEEAARVIGLNAKPLWSRAKGWLTGEEYRTLDIIPDKNPTITHPNKGADHPLLRPCLRVQRRQETPWQRSTQDTPTHSPLLPSVRENGFRQGTPGYRGTDGGCERKRWNFRDEDFGLF
jgi:predicted nucleotidyltransferase